MGHQRPTCFCLFVCADNDDQITVAMCECATSETLLLLQQEMQIEQQEVCDPWFSSSANKTTGPRGYNTPQSEFTRKHWVLRIWWTDVLPGTQTLIELRTQFSKTLNTTLLCYLRVFHHQLTADDQRCQVHSVQDVARKIALNLENWNKKRMEPAFAAGREGCSYRRGGRLGRPRSTCWKRELACGKEPIR